MSNITLSEAIQNLRSELLVAMQRDSGDQLRFQLGPVEMELQVGVTREASAKGGLKWWLIEAGGEAKSGSSSTHKIKLVLDPIGADGQRIKVSDDVPRPR